MIENKSDSRKMGIKSLAIGHISKKRSLEFSK